MADYNVNEVLNTIFGHEDAAWRPSDKKPLIIKEIESCKNELKTFLSNSGYNIQSIIDESKELCSESKLLVDHLEKFQKDIEDETMAELVSSIEKYNSLYIDLESINYARKLVGEVIQCGRLLKDIEEARKGVSFSRSIEAACDLVDYLSPGHLLEHLDIASKTEEIAKVTLESLLQDLDIEWNKLIHWEVKSSSQKTVINIYIAFVDSILCCDILRAMSKCRKMPEKITAFGNFICNDVVKLMMSNETSVMLYSDYCLSVALVHKPNFKSSHEDVILNCRKLFDFLSKRLKMPVRESCEKTLIEILGEQVSQKIADILIEDCFIDTIPNNIYHLQTYGHITKNIENFQSFLVSIKLFPADNSVSILKYVENIDLLFADKTSKHLLEYARTIMVKDLSSAMSIGIKKIPEQSPSTDNSTQEDLIIFDKIIPNSFYYFPRCMISKSAQELVDLLYTTMEQAVQCPDVVCKKLYNTSRLILELYDAVVPYHHENYLQTIPHYVALFHNNCMYLAHNMLTFGDKWKTLMEGREASYPISFVDLVQKLRDLGYKHLTIHMQQQRKQILDNIRSSDLNCIVSKDVLGDDAEAAVRQCLRQLHLLKNVWIGVFPSNVFIRLMATLVNMFVDELIHRVVTVEDISIEMATQLTDMYQLVVQKAPQLFQATQDTNTQNAKQSVQERTWSSEDMQTHVRSWMKLQELIFVLRGSLKDIDNHWNEGTGPLAIHFKTEELRSLIKALFQNTQMRASLLYKIK